MNLFTDYNALTTILMYSAARLFDILYMITGEKALEVTAFHCLAGASFHAAGHAHGLVHLVGLN